MRNDRFLYAQYDIVFHLTTNLLRIIFCMGTAMDRHLLLNEIIIFLKIWIYDLNGVSLHNGFLGTIR